MQKCLSFGSLLALVARDVVATFMGGTCEDIAGHGVEVVIICTKISFDAGCDGVLSCCMQLGRA